MEIVLPIGLVPEDIRFITLRLLRAMEEKWFELVAVAQQLSPMKLIEPLFDFRQVN